MCVIPQCSPTIDETVVNECQYPLQLSRRVRGWRLHSQRQLLLQCQGGGGERGDGEEGERGGGEGLQGHGGHQSHWRLEEEGEGKRQTSLQTMLKQARGQRSLGSKVKYHMT